MDSGTGTKSLGSLHSDVQTIPAGLGHLALGRLAAGLRAVTHLAVGHLALGRLATGHLCPPGHLAMVEVRCGQKCNGVLTTQVQRQMIAGCGLND